MVSAFLGVSTVCYERWGWGKGELGEKGFGDEAGEGKLESVGGGGGGGEGKSGHTFSGKKIGNQLIMPGLLASIVKGLVLSSTPG